MTSNPPLFYPHALYPVPSSSSPPPSIISSYSHPYHQGPKSLLSAPSIPLFGNRSLKSVNFDYEPQIIDYDKSISGGSRRNPHRSSSDNEGKLFPSGSDIYYDRSQVHLDDIGTFQFPPQLDPKFSQGANSELGDLFKPDSDPDFPKKQGFSFLNYLENVVSEVDDRDSHRGSMKVSNWGDSESEKSALSDVNSQQSDDEGVIKAEPKEEDKDQIVSPTKFMKNEGKLVFKVTRVDRLTMKEKKCMTNARRIITKCPHTSAKYYAKGMCKKCYHTFGRDKKATVCGHTDKPLYAKGYWKKCYLSKYKQETNSKKRGVGAKKNGTGSNFNRATQHERGNQGRDEGETSPGINYYYSQPSSS